MKLGQPERHCYQVNKKFNKQGVFLILPALRLFGRDKSGHGRALMLLIAFALKSSLLGHYGCLPVIRFMWCIRSRYPGRFSAVGGAGRRQARRDGDNSGFY